MDKPTIPAKAKRLLHRAGKKRTETAIALSSDPSLSPSALQTITSSDDPDLLKARIAALGLVGLGPKTVSRRLGVSQPSAATLLNAALREAGELTPAKLAVLTSRMFSVLVVSSTLATSEYISRVIALQMQVESLEKEGIKARTTEDKAVLNKQIGEIRGQIDNCFRVLGKFSSDLTGSLSAMGVPRIVKEQGKDTHTPSSTTDNFYNSLVGKGDLVDDLVRMAERQLKKAREVQRKQRSDDLGVVTVEDLSSEPVSSDGGCVLGQDLGEKVDSGS